MSAQSQAVKLTAQLQKTHDSFFGELEALRLKIAELQTEIEWTLNAPLPQDEAIKRIESYIDYQRSEFFVGSCVATLSAPDGRAADIETFKGDVAPILCWLDPDRMRDALTDALKDSAIEAGLPFADRADRVSKLEGRLFSLETEEESLLCSAEELGLRVFRRIDASPEIVLGIEGDDEPPKPKRYVSQQVGPSYDGAGNEIRNKKPPIRRAEDLPYGVFDSKIG